MVVASSDRPSVNRTPPVRSPLNPSRGWTSAPAGLGTQTNHLQLPKPLPPLLILPNTRPSMVTRVTSVRVTMTSASRNLEDSSTETELCGCLCCRRPRTRGAQRPVANPPTVVSKGKLDNPRSPTLRGLMRSPFVGGLGSISRSRPGRITRSQSGAAGVERAQGGAADSSSTNPAGISFTVHA